MSGHSDGMRVDPIKDAQWFTGILIALIHMGAIPLEIVTRRPRSFGNRYLGVWAAISVFMAQPCFAYVWVLKQMPTTGGALYWEAWRWSLGLFVCQSLLARSRLLCEHSLYIGNTWIGRSRRAQTNFETLVAAFGGFVLMAWSPPLGAFVWFTGACNLAHIALITMRDIRNVQKINDGLSAGRVVQDDLNRYRGR